MIYHFDELSFQILNVDLFRHEKGFFEVKGRGVSALSYRVSGSGDFEVMNKKFTVEVGDVLFIPANTSYKVNYSVSESIVVHFLDCNYPLAENIRVSDPTLVEHKFRCLLERWREHHSVNLAKAEVYDILHALELDGGRENEGQETEAVAAYMSKRLDDPTFSVSDACAYAHVSASSLQRAFLKRFGLSPKQYLDKLRMSRAMELLAEGGHTVREIALGCGYSDEKYFARAFKRKHGHPPSYFNGK